MRTSQIATMVQVICRCNRVPFDQKSTRMIRIPLRGVEEDRADQTHLHEVHDRGLVGRDDRVVGTRETRTRAVSRTCTSRRRRPQRR